MLLQFDGIPVNYGNGYVESGNDHGKFIAPFSGTYTFTVSLRNDDPSAWVYGSIRSIWEGGHQNLCRVTSRNNAREMTGCTAVVKLTARDVVAVVNHYENNGYYSARYTAFSGHLVKRDAE